MDGCRVADDRCPLGRAPEKRGTRRPETRTVRRRRRRPASNPGKGRSSHGQFASLEMASSNVTRRKKRPRRIIGRIPHPVAACAGFAGPAGTARSAPAFPAAMRSTVFDERFDFRCAVGWLSNASSITAFCDLFSPIYVCTGGLVTKLRAADIRSDEQGDVRFAPELVFVDIREARGERSVPRITRDSAKNGNGPDFRRIIYSECSHAEQELAYHRCWKRSGCCGDRFLSRHGDDRFAIERAGGHDARGRPGLGWRRCDRTGHDRHRCGSQAFDFVAMTGEAPDSSSTVPATDWRDQCRSALALAQTEGVAASAGFASTRSRPSGGLQVVARQAALDDGADAARTRFMRFIDRKRGGARFDSQSLRP